MKELRAFLSQIYKMVPLYIYRKSYLHGDEDEFFLLLFYRKFTANESFFISHSSTI